MCQELQIFAVVYTYVFGCRVSLVRLCDSDFGITPTDDITIGITCAITIGITCAAFCFHIAHISFASSWYLFCLSVIVLLLLLLLLLLPLYSYLSLTFFKSLDKDDWHFWHLSSHQRPLQITCQSDVSSGDQKDGNRCAPHRHLLARCGTEIMDHFPLETPSCTQLF